MIRQADLHRSQLDVRARIKSMMFQLGASGKPRFDCPVCGYHGPFMDVSPPSGLRRNAKCPGCRAMERHRLQFVIMEDLLGRIDASNMALLHFAPEDFFSPYFAARFGRYETADLEMDGVDYNVDLQQLPFDDESYDFVYASHVLEHVPDDRKALGEIRRILRPGGIAVIPVPIIADKTVEYTNASPLEFDHVRAPGLDYYERYEPFFSRVDTISSGALPENFQLYLYEDRSQWPSKELPDRPAMQGERHVGIVPICYV